MVVDADSGRREVVDVKLPLPPSLEGFAVAPDGRALLYGGLRAEADIWIVNASRSSGLGAGRWGLGAGKTECLCNPESDWVRMKSVALSAREGWAR